LILSDSSVPGEGEHKIMDFIRSQRAQIGYNQNTSHCMYGGDADLIMLGLSTHEVNFYLIRETDLNTKAVKFCNKCKASWHMTYECGVDLSKKPLLLTFQFQFIYIAVVREYLALEVSGLQCEYDFERVVDDFVFLSFFVGNDFLPHLPSLRIREGALDALMVIYKNLLPQIDDYLTCQGKINLNEVNALFRDISKLEEEQLILYEKKC
jgi:5'-3' exoribonuclease 2